MSIPVVPDPNLPPGEWRLFDTDGNELAVGNVNSGAHTPTGVADAFGGYECACGQASYSHLHAATGDSETPR